jgi:hypothetical protein
MTKSELEAIIDASVERKLLELIGDPDSGLALRKSVRDRLRRQKKTVNLGQRGERLQSVARRLGLH